MPKMRMGKDSWLYEIRLEMINYGVKQIFKWLKIVFQTAWEWGKLPSEWGTNIIVSLNKRVNKKNCQNYRTICLSSVGFKLYTRILENK